MTKPRPTRAGRKPKPDGAAGRDPVVLIGVLRDRRDLDLLLKRRWYRIPARSCPSRSFDLIAFYQPSSFGRQGKAIRRYARALDCRTLRRKDLLPGEPGHPRASEDYHRFRFGKVTRLARPIGNSTPRRVSFGFTTLARLLRARDVLELFDVSPLEDMLGKALHRAGIRALPEHTVSQGGRFRLDFAVPCREGRIDIECDGRKWHSSPGQRSRDTRRDRLLGRRGWTVLRLKEAALLEDMPGCIRRVRREIRRLGGASRS